MRLLRRFVPASAVLLAAVASLGLAATLARPALADDGSICSPELKHRTPQEVIEEHVALIQAGNLDQAMCDYAEDAVVMLPGQVIRGVTNIRPGLEAFGSLFGGATPTNVTFTTDGPVVMITFSVFGPQLSIPNGSDTYIVEKGLIKYQTVHDVIVPTNP